MSGANDDLKASGGEANRLRSVGEPRSSTPEGTAEYVVVVGVGAQRIADLAALLDQYAPPPDTAYVIVPTKSAAFHEVGEVTQDIPSVRRVDGEVGAPIEPGHAYLITEGRGADVANGRIVARAAPADTLAWFPLDVSLGAFAAEFGGRLVALLLCEPTVEGAAGLRKVDSEGGAVLVANDVDGTAWSQEDSVAIRYQVPMSELYRALQRTLAWARDAQTANAPDADVERILRELSATGRPLSDYEPRRLRFRAKRRLARVPAQKGLSVEDLELDAVVDEIWGDASWLFRDDELWQALLTTHLPNVVANLPQGEVLKVWVPACASAENAYSLAVSLADALRAERRAATDFKLFATDQSGRALQAAARGWFSAPELSSVPKDVRARYFAPQGHGFEVTPSVRGALRFGEHDLTRDPALRDVDIVFCRHALGRFATAAKSRAINTLIDALVPSGLLVADPGDLSSVSGLRALNAQLGLFERDGLASTADARQSAERVSGRGTFSGPLPSAPSRAAAPPPPEPASASQAAPERPHGATNPELARILSSLGIGILVFDREQRLLDFANVVELGVATVRLSDLGRMLPTIPLDFAYADFAADAKRVLAIGEPCDYEAARHTGGDVRVRIVPYRASGGRSEGILVTLEVITEFKRIERSLARVESRFRQLMGSEMLTVFVGDLATGELMDANETALAMLGFARSSLPRPAADLFRSDDVVNGMHALDTLRQQGTVASHRATLLRADKSPIPVDIGYVLLDALAATFAIVVNDRRPFEAAIRRGAEHARHRVEALDVLREFVLGLTHRIDEPIRSIGETARMLRATPATEAAGIERDLEDVIGNVATVETLLDSAQGYAQALRIDQHDEIVDAQIEFAETLSEMNRKFGAFGGLRTASDETLGGIGVVDVDSLPTVRAPRLAIRRVFAELLDNAVKFRADRPLRVWVSAVQRGDVWEFAVRDNGLGFSRFAGRDNFLPFRRPLASDTAPGNGLGLALCQHLVRAWDGEMWVESGGRAGAELRFTVPVVERSSGAAES